jgi:enamine deaminase RidA (YjgF/YER057c/UK114 family)
MVTVEEQLSLALANLNTVSKSLGVIKDMIDRTECQMVVEEYFQTLLTMEKVNEAIVSLERVVQRHRDINNRC